MADFDPDQYLAEKSQTTSAATQPTEGVSSDQGSSDFDPDQYLYEKTYNPAYDTLGQKALGVTEQIGQGALGPIATAAEMGLSRLGVPGVTQEDVAARKQDIGPWLTGAAKTTGFIGSMYLGPLKMLGLGAEGALASNGLYDAAATGIQKYGQNIFKAMVESFGIGVQEESNKQLTGESQPASPEDAIARTLSEGGASMLFGGATAGLFTGAADTASAGLRKFAASKIGQKAVDFARDFGSAMSPASDELGNIEASAPIQEKTGIKSTNLGELQNRLQQLGGVPTSTSRSSIESASSRVEMKNPFHPLQLMSLDSPEASESYQMAKERQDDVGKILRDTELFQKNELVGKTDSTIRDVAGTDAVTSDKIEGGNQASKYFTDQYQNEKKEAGALVGQAKSLDSEGVDHLSGVLNSMSNAVPGIKDMIDTSGDTIKVLPYKTSMGITDQTYGAVKKAISSLQDNPTKFSDLFNIRKGLSNGINKFTSDPSAVSEIGSLKSSMMNYLQDMATPDLREGFKRYAINEDQREVIEKAFGASVGNKEFGQISKVSPETVIKDIFSDSASINAAKNILPKEQYNHLLGNWLSQARDAATDAETGVFSSRKFASFLKTNAPKLDSAFSEDPNSLQRIRDLTTMMKVVPDAPPVSPAIYDKSILEHLKGSSGLTDAAMSTVKYLKDSAMKNIDRQKTIRELNKILALDKQDPNEMTKKVVDVLSKKIGRPIKPHSIPLALKTMATNPEALADALDHADSMWKGDTMVQRLVNDLFTGGRARAQEDFEESKTKEKIRKFIEDGTLDKQIKNSLNQSMPQQQNYAEGGVVSNQGDPHQEDMNSLSSVIPDQAMLMATAKSRVAGYLNNIRPLKAAKLPFDEDKKDPDKERVYEKALTIADKPLSIMKEIKNGTIEPEQIQHMKQMWPEIYGLLSKKMTKRLLENRVDEQKMPPFHIRQSMSMFLGTPLDSTMTPSAIQAAQSVFVIQKAASQMAAAPSVKNKKDTSKMGEMSKQHLTGPQAAESRQLSASR